MTGSRSYPNIQDSSPVIMVFMELGSLFVESSLSWVDGYDLETKMLRYFPYNENPTRVLNTSSLNCCLPSTDAIDRWEKIHACVWRFKVTSCTYIWEAWPLTLSEECKLTVFENRILRQIFGPKREMNGEWRRLHKDEFLSLYLPFTYYSQGE